jgi:transcriptional regulator with XRE-family HTH domain
MLCEQDKVLRRSVFIMAKKDSTVDLMHKIQTANSVTEMFSELKKASDLPTVGAYLDGIRMERGLKKEQLFTSVGISAIFGYEILRGVKSPSRDTLLQFAFAFNMSVEETQRLLSIGEKAQLYPKLMRDAHIIYALSHEFSLVEFNVSAISKGILPIGNY